MQPLLDYHHLTQTHDLYQTYATLTRLTQHLTLMQPLPDSPDLYKTRPDQTDPSSTRLTQPLPVSPNLYHTHKTSTRLTKPPQDSPNLYQTDPTSTRLTKPLVLGIYLCPVLGPGFGLGLVLAFVLGWSWSLSWSWGWS